MPRSDHAENSDTNFRYTFGLTNFALDDRLQIGEICIEPIEEAQQALKEESSLSTTSLVTSKGIMEFNNNGDVSEAKARIGAQHMDMVCLLLSLSSRSHVQMVQEIYKEQRSDEWAVVDGSIDRPFIGKVKPRPIYETHDDLVRFIDIALPILIDDKGTGKRGLVTALRMFCSTYEFDYGEPLYLKTWMALEVLFGKFNGDAKIIDDKDFRKLRSRLKAFLNGDDNRDVLPEASIDAVKGKLGELQRYSARDQVKSFLESVFAANEYLIPTDSEFTRFSRVRNQITHTGRFDPAEEQNYNKEIFDLRLQLASLLECVFYAMLGISELKIETDWRNASRGGGTS